MVLDISEIRTAWQDSDFITDCLCWHNVYRQRHAAQPLVMSSEVFIKKKNNNNQFVFDVKEYLLLIFQLERNTL